MELNEFYKKTIDIIYAFIIGQSFLQLDSLFIPISTIFEFHKLVDIGALFLAYFITIIGWIGYHKSIMNRPHIGRLGNMRFSVDLFIVFLVYYLIRLASPTSKVPYYDTFIWLIPVLFSTYLVWDTIKFFEYRNQSDEKRVEPKRLGITALFLGVVILSGLAYYLLIPTLTTNPQNFWNNKTILDTIFIPIAFTITIFYRLKKWKVERDLPPRHSI